MMDDNGGRVFEHPFHVHYYECDARLRLSVSGALRYFEEIALMQSESLGVGLRYYARHGVAWLLSRWDLRLLRMPPYGSTVTVRTQPRGYRGFSAMRSFEVTDGGAGNCVEAESMWIFLDTSRRRPARVHSAVAEAYGVSESEGMLVPPDEPARPERIDAQRDFGIRRGDIDHNGHVNNVRYVEWALESLPAGDVSGKDLIRLLVHYTKELRYGAEVCCGVQIDTDGGGLRCRHEVRAGDVVACRLESIWTDTPSEAL